MAPYVEQHRLRSQMNFLLEVVVVHETSLVPEISITFSAGDSNGGESARGARHTVATHWLTHACNVSPTHFVTCLHALHMYHLAMATVRFTIT